MTEPTVTTENVQEVITAGQAGEVELQDFLNLSDDEWDLMLAEALMSEC